MTAGREAIAQALFARVTGTGGFATVGRKLRHWTDVQPAERPALFQVQKGETWQRQRGLPPKVTLHLDLYLYVGTAADPSVPPAAELNPLLDAIQAALAPPPSDSVQTLGGLVDHAWISGRVETDEGVLGDLAVAIIPIDILIP
ncbi:MAG TPA: hypothetical protein VNT30_10410 [Stellaceae bacterium]|nr:hypothetical protein [Stellaceae bacterium]